MSKNHPLTALILSGGGARGAYEAGVMHYIHSVLAKDRDIAHHFDIYCGSSVGSINTCYLAGASHLDPITRGNTLYQTWKELKQEQIYLRDVRSLTSFIFRTMSGVTLNFLRSPQKDRSNAKTHFQGFFDTRPLPFFLKHHINFRDLNKNVDDGLVTAVALTATNLRTDQMELFLKKKEGHPYNGPYTIHETKLGFKHAMASAAIPIFFPAIRINGLYYVDGGMRLNTPLSPAIQLGAQKILIIGLHNVEERRSAKEIENADMPPTLGELIGKMLNSIFLDRADYDLEQLDRINAILQWGKARYGEGFLDEINKVASKVKNRRNIEKRSLKEIKALCISPSRDVRKLFFECINEPHSYKQNFGAFERLFLKILDVDLIQGQDFLSYLMFLPNYLSRLLDLGFEDAKARADEIAEFLATS